MHVYVCLSLEKLNVNYRHNPLRARAVAIPLTFESARLIHLSILNQGYTLPEITVLT